MFDELWPSLVSFTEIMHVYPIHRWAGGASLCNFLIHHFIICHSPVDNKNSYLWHESHYSKRYMIIPNQLFLFIWRLSTNLSYLVNFAERIPQFVLEADYHCGSSNSMTGGREIEPRNRLCCHMEENGVWWDEGLWRTWKTATEPLFYNF